jgi:hypothetical protein
MDPELQKKIDAARADGYTDEEIQSYLQSQQSNQQATPAPETSPYENRDRSEEYIGMAQAAAPMVVEKLIPPALLVGSGVAGKALYDKYGHVLKNALQKDPADLRQYVDNKPRPPAAPITPAGPPSVAEPIPINRIPPQPQPPSRATQLLDKTTQMVRQLAANKLLQNAARIGGTAAFALTPSNLGPPVPESGPYRGMELNPNTGRPWTRQELEALR